MINRIKDVEGPSKRLRQDDAERSQSSFPLDWKDVEHVVQKYPVAVVTAGLLAGMTLGWWVKRK